MWIERHFSIGQVDETAWRALEPPDFPFFDLEFLHALERSGSIGRRSGWSPVYLVCGDGREVLGALPLYLKIYRRDPAQRSFRNLPSPLPRSAVRSP